MIPDYPVGKSITIPEQGTWPRSVHVFKELTVAALQAAEATGRPLLVRGKPGVGKSETARAAAAFAQRPFLSVVIDGRTEPEDLKWRVDAVRRLSDAQGHDVKDEIAYVAPEALWWAYDWGSARQQALGIGRTPEALPQQHPAWRPKADRAVLLLDEIDKADPDLPNALLEVLANKGFTPPFAKAPPVRCTDETRPLVIITTNEERELPAAFLRRCLVLKLELPTEPEALKRELVQLAQRHEADARDALDPEAAKDTPAPRVDPIVMEEAADLFLRLRTAAEQAEDYVPSTSEFLDLIRALAGLYPGDTARQRERMKVLAGFVDKTLRIR